MPTYEAIERYGRPEPPLDPTPWLRWFRAIVIEPYKFIWSSDGKHELYDLSADPGETKNLIGSLPAEARRLQAAWIDGLARSNITIRRNPRPDAHSSFPRRSGNGSKRWDTPSDTRPFRAPTASLTRDFLPLAAAGNLEPHLLAFQQRAVLTFQLSRPEELTRARPVRLELFPVANSRPHPLL